MPNPDSPFHRLAAIDSKTAMTERLNTDNFIHNFKTYAAFIAHSQRMQRRYIAEEQKRYEKLMNLWLDYQAKASKLGLHALERHEIVDRFDQLRTMLARVEETHGDTPGQRALWEARQAEAVRSCLT